MRSEMRFPSSLLVRRSFAPASSIRAQAQQALHRVRNSRPCFAQILAARAKPARAGRNSVMHAGQPGWRLRASGEAQLDLLAAKLQRALWAAGHAGFRESVMPAQWVRQSAQVATFALVFRREQKKHNRSDVNDVSE